MWRVVLGVAVFLQVGTTRADESGEADEKESAAQVDCPSDSSDADCVADEAAVSEAPPVAAAVVAPAPGAFATVSFRNDVGKKLRLVEAQFTMDGAKLPVVLTSAEPGKSYVIVSGAMKSGPHVVTARLTYRGDRGVFSYMNGYKLNVKSDQVLTAPADRAVSFTVVGAENRGLTVPLERRVVVRVEQGAAAK